MGSPLEDIVRSDRRAPATLPFRAALRGLSLLYGAGIGIRNGLYDRGVLKGRNVPCTVLGIGGLTAGGVGKTPLVILTARLLGEKGMKVAVVSRGYRRESRGVVVVSYGSGAIIPPREAGDEPHLIASSLPGVPVIVGERRYDAAAEAWERFRPDAVVLDDGFQHRALRRDADAVALDFEHPFGNGFLLPRGMLREPPVALGRARAVVFTRCPEGFDRERGIRLVRKYNPGAKAFFAVHELSGLRRLGGGDVFDPSRLGRMKVAALSNIADPVSFHRMIGSLGADIVHVRAMADHHRHSGGELERFGRESALSGAEMIVMTAKDERDLPESFVPSGMPWYVMDVEMRLDDPGGYVDIMLG
jgi:tetraacyldisaccharide 4'-kinase